MKKSSIYFGVIIFFLLIFFILSIKPKKTFFPRENEIKIYNEEKINKKIEKLETQLKLNPNDVNVMVELGIYYFIKGPQFYDKAINLLYQAWHLGSTDIRIFYYLGCMYEFLKLYVLAAEEYKKFLTNVPNDVEVMIRIGNVFYKLDKTKDAIDYYTKVLKIDKNNILALTNLGYIYFEQKDITNAVECFSQVVKISNKKNIIPPKNVNFYLGKIFFENKNYLTAKEYFLNEQQKYPDNIDNSLLLVRTYYYLGDYENAYQLTNQLVELIPEHRELINLHRELKRKLQKV
ncbi:MAG: tetratricopeptide repeat protein [Endomicrobia bacterium]|nr:tetratricopeptide repeat protein [Endomicrobiia bacterium]